MEKTQTRNLIPDAFVIGLEGTVEELNQQNILSRLSGSNQFDTK